MNDQQQKPRNLIIPADVTSAVTSEEALQLARLARNKVMLELGAHYGFSTIVLASVADKVYSVDWHRGDIHAGMGDSWQAFNFNLIRYGVADRVVICRGRFESEVPKLAEQGIICDGAFIDGMHDEESVSRDLALALLVVKPGGFISFHDFGRGPSTGHSEFKITEVATRFGVQGVVGTLAWGTVPEA
jgi:predicted O-methyltransferase YrrM